MTTKKDSSSSKSTPHVGSELEAKVREAEIKVTEAEAERRAIKENEQDELKKADAYVAQRQEEAKQAQNELDEFARRQQTDEINKTIKSLRNRLNAARTGQIWYVSLAMALGILVPVALSVIDDTAMFQPMYVGLAVSLLLAAGFAVNAIVKHMRISDLEDEVQNHEFELEMMSTTSASAEGRAEKLLSIHQYQLRRYYDQNINQSFWVFIIGVFSLLTGIVIVAITLYILVERVPDALVTTQVTVAAVGAVGALLTNFVAVIYLRMHGETTATLRNFHGRLVATHDLFFANLLASRVLPDTERGKVISQMALAITRYTSEIDKQTDNGK